MKNIKLQLVDLNGKVDEESIISIEDNDTLLVEYNQDEINLKDIKYIFTMIKDSLENGSGLIAYPKGLTFKVLKKN